MTNHEHVSDASRPQKRFRRLQDLVLVTTWIATAGGIIVGGVVVIDKHAAWMKKVDDVIQHKKDDETIWRPLITENTKNIAVINSQLATLLAGQKRIEDKLDGRLRFRTQSDEVK